ncbi:MAG: alcohol dehydrogenase catalytic domain-containing protein, partial [bacterium]
MVKAMRMHKVGGPEVLVWEDVDVAAPKPGEALIRHTAVGLNYIDTYHRSGLYPVPMPAIIGSEGAGVVEAVGEGVSEVAVGDRVAYGNAPIGAYAEKRTLPAHRLLKLPAGISDRQAASMMLKGMTAQYLIRRTYRVKAG